MAERSPQPGGVDPSGRCQRARHQNNDHVQVFNDRGTIELQAKVTPRIIRGVCSVPEGAWYKPDAKRADDKRNPIDRNGCLNVLTRYHPSALAKSNPQYTNNVQIRKIS